MKINFEMGTISINANPSVSLDMSADEVKSLVANELGGDLIRRLSSDALGGLCSKAIENKFGGSKKAKADKKVETYETPNIDGLSREEIKSRMDAAKAEIQMSMASIDKLVKSEFICDDDKERGTWMLNKMSKLKKDIRFYRQVLKDMADTCTKPAESQSKIDEIMAILSGVDLDTLLDIKKAVDTQIINVSPNEADGLD